MVSGKWPRLDLPEEGQTEQVRDQARHHCVRSQPQVPAVSRLGSHAKAIYYLHIWWYWPENPFCKKMQMWSGAAASQLAYALSAKLYVTYVI